MTGKILEFNVDKNKGTILSGSGNKYQFHISEWKEKGTYPTKDTHVEFMLEEEKAIYIYSINEKVVAKEQESKAKSSMFSKVSFISGILGVVAFFYFAYNHASVEKGYFYTIAPLFAILTGHISKKSILASLGLSLGYIVTMMYLIIIAIASFL